MKINVELNICEDDNMYDIEHSIIQEAARQMINEVLNNRYENHGRTFREKLHDEIREMLLGIMDSDFKESVKKDVVEDLSKKYRRTKQYKEIKSEFGIESDSVIKSGMRDMISDIVRVEMKKIFK